MTWNITWTRTALRDMAGLDRQVARRIVAKVEQVADDPARRMKRVKSADEHRLRVGDYCILAMLSFDEATIIVERVGHGKNVNK